MKTTPKTNRLPRRSRRAFTLIEIIIVIALIGVIMSLAVPQLVETFSSAKEDAERIKVTSTLKAAITRYYTNIGRLPSNEEGLGVLLVQPQNGADKWRGPYVESEANLVDSWGNPYQYRRPGLRNPDTYDLWSLGPDGQDNTADDIGNWATATPATN
ncbi:MAG: type II secretion system major pseudopilin GspG [Puniceicoccales bacterium]|nr:type II secretion system major pseudopilin GspG [Puniceicoccales bacterium]